MTNRNLSPSSHGGTNAHNDKATRIRSPFYQQGRRAYDEDGCSLSPPQLNAEQGDLWLEGFNDRQDEAKRDEQERRKA